MSSVVNISEYFTEFTSVFNTITVSILSNIDVPGKVAQLHPFLDGVGLQ